MRIFVLPIFDGFIMYVHLIFQSSRLAGNHHSKYWMPIHYNNIKDWENKKNLIFYSQILNEKVTNTALNVNGIGQESVTFEFCMSVCMEYVYHSNSNPCGVVTNDL